MQILNFFFSYYGKIGRGHYWALVLLFLFVIGSMNPAVIESGLGTLVGLVLFVSFFSAIVRRARDAEYSISLSIIFTIIPYFNIIWLIVLGSFKDFKVDNAQNQTDEARYSSNDNPEFNQTDTEAHTYQVPPETSDSSRIIVCLGCQQKIKIPFPPPSNSIGTCPLCQQQFLAQVDAAGHLTIYRYVDNEQTQNTQDSPLRSVQDALDILGVNASASPDEIKKAYKKLMMQYHPDKVANLGSELQALAEQKTKQINSAYRFLREAGLAI